MNIFSGMRSVFCWQIGALGALLAKRNVHTNHLDPKRSARKRARYCQMNGVNTNKYKTNTNRNDLDQKRLCGGRVYHSQMDSVHTNLNT